MRAKILVIDDEPDLRELVKAKLEVEGFHVIGAETGEEGLELMAKESPDLIILDLRLPGIDGLDVCRRIRHEHSTPIIMLTAKVEESDVVVGLEMGADEYIRKPFQPKELVARVRALLRRANIYSQPRPEEKETLEFDDLTINLSTHDVTVGGELVSLRPLEFHLLSFFAKNPNRVLTRDVIQDNVWEEDVFIDSRALDVHVRRLRQKIEKDPSNPQHIVTVRGFGYKFS